MKSFWKKHKSIRIISYLVIGYILALSIGGIVTAIIPDKEEEVQTYKPPVLEIKEPITADGLYIAINAEKTKLDLATYSRNPKLDESANLKCQDMVRNSYYAHENPSTGKTGYKYISDAGVRFAYASENLNMGSFKNANAVIDSWMSSESHKASIVDPRFTEIGFAVCDVQIGGNTGTVVVQHKIEVYVAPQQTQRTYVPAYTPPTTTYCTHEDYGGYFSPTTTCRSY